MKKVRKITCYAFGILGVLSGLMLMYFVFSGETNQLNYALCSIEFFVSTAIFLIFLKVVQNDEIS